jgi:hypothetical protein
MTTVAPRRRNQAASGTQALRVGSITTVTEAPGGIDSHSCSRSAGVVRNRRPDQANRPDPSARLAWCAARQATSIPSVICTGRSSFAIASSSRRQGSPRKHAPDIR